MTWIIENAQWLFTALSAGVGTVWVYFSEKKSKKLQEALTAAQVRLQEVQVDDAHLDINTKVNAAVDAALERALKLHAGEIQTIVNSYNNQIELLRSDIESAQTLRVQAVELASTYEALIDKLKKYNTYLKGVLDGHSIVYKREDEI